MVLNSSFQVILLIFSDLHVRISAICIVSICGLISFTYSWFFGLTLLSCYILGYVATYFLVKHQPLITSSLEKFLKSSKPDSIHHKLLKSSCSICDDLTCHRHLVAKSLTPWKHIRVIKELNQSVENFFNKILSQFVSSWYQQFSENDEFVNELRHCFKYASSMLINRILDIDFVEVICTKLVPQAVKHVDDYLYMQQIAKLKNVKFNDVLVEYLGQSLHPATTNRQNELEYLRNLSSRLIGCLLPEHCVDCKNYQILMRELMSGWVFLPMMDVVADPNIINALVNVAINHKSSATKLTSNNFEEFLTDFVKISETSSPFATNLNKIKNNTELLYALMQYLKKEQQVHLLQFCLDVDDFNTKLLTPDLSKQQLEELHVQACNLHKEYLNETSFNFIDCPIEICREFSELIDDIYSVAKLRTSKPLYQAYDFAFNLLESIWLPQFFHSNEFYNCICGSKVTNVFHRPPTKSKKYSDPGTVSKISSGFGKIRGVLKSSGPIDGALDIDFVVEPETVRDLTNWKVKINKYQIIPLNKIAYFCVNVYHQTDENARNNWTVWRKDQDFFTLKAKLVEFHGEDEISDSPLPSRRAGSLVESRLVKYEDFLKKLLNKPSLRGSDLLHTFLTTEEDFTLVISTLAPTNQDIGNIYQSVAYKLRKEKGQKLDSFINTFVSSVTRPKLDKVDLAEELIEEISLPKTVKNTVFNDNLGISLRHSYQQSGISFTPKKISESFFYLLRQVLKVQPIILRIYVAICSVFQELVDHFAKILIEKKIRSGLTQHNLAYLIGLLQVAIFSPHPHSRDELEIRKKKALETIQFCPEFINKVLGGNVNKGLEGLLEILQNPHYNKQLVYNLLDVILVEMFPELNCD